MSSIKIYHWMENLSKGQHKIIIIHFQYKYLTQAVSFHSSNSHRKCRISLIIHHNIEITAILFYSIFHKNVQLWDI